MSIVIGIVVILAVVAAVFYLNRKGNEKNEQARIEEEIRRAEEEKQKAEALKREQELALFSAKKDFYQYINQNIKIMNQTYQNGEWEKLEHFDGPAASVMEYEKKIAGDLSDESNRLLQCYYSSVSVHKNEDGTYTTDIKDKDGLQEFYFKVMIPFYRLYSDFLDGELRYNTMLGKETLNLFKELTGKTFHIGFKNKYSNGMRAYEYDEKSDRYIVKDKNGELLCDATFDGNRVDTGYAVVPENSGNADWNVATQGQWEKGELIKGIKLYRYNKPCL